MMPDAYELWLDQVRDALRSINMHIEEWQGVWPFDFSAEHEAGSNPRRHCNESQSLLVASAKQVSEAELPEDAQLLAAPRSPGQLPACL